VEVTFEYDRKGLMRLSKDSPRLFERTIRRLGASVEREAKLLVGGKIGRMKAEATGNLGASIGHRIVGKGRGTAAEIYATARYAEWVHEGTGIYGPLKRPIVVRAKRAKALSFFWRGKAMIVRSVSIKGMRPRPFLREAVRLSLSQERMGEIVR